MSSNIPVDKLSENFDWEEVTRSDTAARLGIVNALPKVLIDTAKRTAVKMEKVRAVLGVPIFVNSWYRCPELNRALMSKETSQHLKCEAVDFTAPNFGTPVQICKKLIENKSLINFDQLIFEHTWVHISWNSIPGGQQKGQVLSLIKDGKYSIGITDKLGKPL